jgi:prolipoprotein diacylglyceryltransferase
VQYFDRATFHPTFLYELIWDLAGVALLIWIGKRWRIRPPGLFALYVAYYCFGRFFEELLRVDPAHHFFGLRLNAWVSAVCFVVASAFFVWWQRGGGQGPPREPRRLGRRKREPAAKEGPAMAIPRGRVR